MTLTPYSRSPLALPGLGLWVQVLGFRVSGAWHLGLGVWVWGFGVEGSELRVRG
jgi:hypothetical protein